MRSEVGVIADQHNLGSFSATSACASMAWKTCPQIERFTAIRRSQDECALVVAGFAAPDALDVRTWRATCVTPGQRIEEEDKK